MMIEEGKLSLSTKGDETSCVCFICCCSAAVKTAVTGAADVYRNVSAVGRIALNRAAGAYRHASAAAGIAVTIAAAGR